MNQEDLITHIKNRIIQEQQIQSSSFLLSQKMNKKDSNLVLDILYKTIRNAKSSHTQKQIALKILKETLWQSHNNELMNMFLSSQLWYFLANQYREYLSSNQQPDLPIYNLVYFEQLDQFLMEMNAKFGLDHLKKETPFGKLWKAAHISSDTKDVLFTQHVLQWVLLKENDSAQAQVILDYLINFDEEQNPNTDSKIKKFIIKFWEKNIEVFENALRSQELQSSYTELKHLFQKAIEKEFLFGFIDNEVYQLLVDVVELEKDLLLKPEQKSAWVDKLILKASSYKETDQIIKSQQQNVSNYMQSIWSQVGQVSIDQQIIDSKNVKESSLALQSIKMSWKSMQNISLIQKTETENKSFMEQSSEIELINNLNAQESFSINKIFQLANKKEIDLLWFKSFAFLDQIKLMQNDHLKVGLKININQIEEFIEAQIEVQSLFSSLQNLAFAVHINENYMSSIQRDNMLIVPIKALDFFQDIIKVSFQYIFNAQFQKYCLRINIPVNKLYIYKQPTFKEDQEFQANNTEKIVTKKYDLDMWFFKSIKELEFIFPYFWTKDNSIKGIVQQKKINLYAYLIISLTHGYQFYLEIRYFNRVDRKYIQSFLQQVILLLTEPSK